MRWAGLISALTLALGLYLLKDGAKVVEKKCRVEPVVVKSRELSDKEELEFNYLVKSLAKESGLDCVEVSEDESGETIKCGYGDGSDVEGFIVRALSLPYDVKVIEFVADDRGISLKIKPRLCLKVQ